MFLKNWMNIDEKSSNQHSIVCHPRYPPPKPERIFVIQYLLIHRLVRISAEICLVRMVADGRELTVEFSHNTHYKQERRNVWTHWLSSQLKNRDVLKWITKCCGDTYRCPAAPERNFIQRHIVSSSTIFLTETTKNYDELRVTRTPGDREMFTSYTEI